MNLLVALAAALLIATGSAQPELAIARDGKLPGITAAFSGRHGLNDIIDEYGQGILEYAAVANPDPNVIAYLVLLGFDVNRKTPAGWTPLMYAVHYNPVPEVAAKLLELGADAGIVNQDGKRASDLVPHNPNPTFSQHAVVGLLLMPATAPVPPLASPLPAQTLAPVQPQPPRSSCVDINTASATELQRIVHIGPARAQELISRRPFASVSDLVRINGIAAARLRDIQAQGLACVPR